MEPDRRSTRAAGAWRRRGRAGPASSTEAWAGPSVSHLARLRAWVPAPRPAPARPGQAAAFHVSMLLQTDEGLFAEGKGPGDQNLGLREGRVMSRTDAGRGEGASETTSMEGKAAVRHADWLQEGARPRNFQPAGKTGRTGPASTLCGLRVQITEMEMCVQGLISSGKCNSIFKSFPSFPL